MKALPLAFVLAPLCALASCSFGGTFGSGPRINGSGQRISVERAAPDYRRLVIKVPATANVRIGGAPELGITGDDNLMPFVTTDIDGDTLTISMQKGNSYRFEEPLVIEVSVPELELLHIMGSGDANVEGIYGPSFEARVSGSGDLNLQGDADLFTAAVSGSGDVTMDVMAVDVRMAISGSGDFIASGQAETLEATISGSGDMDLDRLEVREATIRISGSGDMRIWATESMDVKVSGSGDVGYRGNPRIQQHIRGSGDLYSISQP